MHKNGYKYDTLIWFKDYSNYKIGGAMPITAIALGKKSNHDLAMNSWKLIPVP